VAYTSDESGTDQVYVVPFRAGGDFRTVPFPSRKWQISTAGGHVPIWRRDGKEILYQDLQGYIVSAEVSTTGAQFRVGEVRPLFKLPPNTGFDVTPDGKRILIKALGDKYSSPVTLLVNWSSKLRY